MLSSGELLQFYSIAYDLYVHAFKVYYLPLGSSLHSSVKRIFPSHLIQHLLIKSAILSLLESASAHSSLLLTTFSGSKL